MRILVMAALLASVSSGAWAFCWIC